jgi:DMSO/TMAO reductase YedYZ molybdopterin-dependent catalytic subunit
MVINVTVNVGAKRYSHIDVGRWKMSKLKDLMVGCGLAVVTSVVWFVSACSPSASTQVVAKPSIGTTMTNPASTTQLPVSPDSTTVTTPTTTQPTVTGGSTPAVSPATTELPQVDISPPTTDSSAVFNIDINTFNLVINGAVNQKLSLTYDQLLAYPSVTQKAEIICPDTEDEWDDWTGVSVSTILNAAGLLPESSDVVFTGNDGYYVRLPLKTVLDSGVILAYQMNGQPLPWYRGYPLRLVVTKAIGSDWLRWVTGIRVTSALTSYSNSSVTIRQLSSNIPKSGNKLCACLLSAAVVMPQNHTAPDKIEPDISSV